MPFYWRRRRKLWFGRRRFRRYTPKYQRRKRFHRRKYRRPFRRRRKRRRRTKVRKKKQTIKIQQWQPDSIVKCKIKGVAIMVLGAQGTQQTCYTFVREDFVPPKTPAGGGFGVQSISLQYLYEEYKFRNNVWTKSNILKDLCRYLYCRVTFFRHQYTDFIVNYERQPPFHLEKFTYTAMHPHQMLLQKHKKLVLSKKTKNNSKLTVKLYIKPPKQMITKWFFTDHFCNYPLVLLKASAASFAYPDITPTGQSQLTNVLYLNQNIFQATSWGLASPETQAYTPYNSTNPVYYKDAKGTNTTFAKPTTYSNSVNYTTGWFNSKFLNARGIYLDNTYSEEKKVDAVPLAIGRYNPTADDGTQTAIWLVSTVKSQPIKPSDEVLKYEGLPLWLLLYGYISYVLQTKNDKRFLDQYYIVFQCPAIYRYPKTHTTLPIIPIDAAFTQGKAPYDQVLTDTQKKLWYPTLRWQMQTINSIVCCGPYIPNYSEERESSWELTYRYCFYFKWGGPETTDQPVKDPSKVPDYDVPDHLQKTVQITNPAKQKASTYTHAWDIRRGMLTRTALKRICEDAETDTDFQPDTETPQKKRKKTTALLKVPQQEEEIQSCLHYLCEENTFQDPQTTDLRQLIQQQQHQQQELKYNLLKLLADLKTKQQILQLQTGLLE
nr:MAG: ORF1 [Torque teno midi virus]